MSRLAKIAGLIIIVGLGILGVMVLPSALLDLAALVIAGVVAGLFWRGVS